MPAQSSRAAPGVQACDAPPTPSTGRDNRRKAPSWVRFHPEKYLQGTAALPLALEAVYWRTCALICAAGDCLPDNDKDMGRLTKAMGAWPRMKAELIARGLLQVDGGCIRQARCSEEIERSRRQCDAKVAGGEARARQMHRGDTPPTSVREGPSQVTENKQNHPSGRYQTLDTKKDSRSPPPTEEAPEARRALFDDDPFAGLDDEPEAPAPAPSPPAPPAPPPEPERSTGEVIPLTPPPPLIPLPPAEQVAVAQRLMDRALVDALLAVGVAKSSAWGLMAKWKKSIGPEKLMEFVLRASRTPPQGSVVAWLEGGVRDELGRRAGRRTGGHRHE